MKGCRNIIELISLREDELEKIYQNPLSVWQELMTDPDKYLSDDEIKAIDEDKELQ